MTSKLINMNDRLEPKMSKHMKMTDAMNRTLQADSEKIHQALNRLMINKQNQLSEKFDKNKRETTALLKALKKDTDERLTKLSSDLNQ